MTVKIRLTRGGRKKQPFYHIVVADERMPRDGRYLEQVGYYNPFAKAHEVSYKIDEALVTKWLGNGAQPTDRVAKMLLTQTKVGSEKQRNAWQKDIDHKSRLAKAKADAKKAEEDAKAAAEAAAAEATAE